MKRNVIKKPFYKQAFPMIIFILLIIYTISFLTPLAWSFMTSLKNANDYNLNRIGLPLYLRSSEYVEKTANPLGILTFDIETFMATIKPVYNGQYGIFKNYLNAWNGIVAERVVQNRSMTLHMDHLLFNSLLYSLVATIITTFAHAITAYVAARYNQFPIIKMLYPIVIFTMLLPIVGNLPSNLKVMRDLGFYDNLIGLWIVKGSFLGTNFLIFYATFKGISWEYAEAAFIDGASHLKVLLNIMLPLAATTVSALSILCFITYWNDWNVNVVYLPNFPMVAYSLYRFRNNVGTVSSNMPVKMAGCLLVALPMVVLFIIFRKKLMGSLTIGGIKG